MSEPPSVEPTLDKPELLISVAKEACDNAAKQYDDYNKTFASLDTKAQNAATVGGVVLGAVIAFVNTERVKVFLQSAPRWAYFLILAPAVSALCVVIVAFVSSRVRKVRAPFSADEQIKEVEHLASLPPGEISSEHVVGYYLGRLEDWKIALADIANAVCTKGNLVKWAQGLLLTSLTLLLILFVRLVATIK